MSVAKGELTKLTKANNTSDSLRTTVPKGISRQFDLKEGDSISWIILQPEKNEDDLRIFVKPIFSIPEKRVKGAKK